MRIIPRPDWLTGSNAALLAEQIRSPFGFTARGRKASAPPVRPAPIGAAQRPALPAVSDGSAAGKLLAVLMALADQDAALPVSDVLGEQIGASPNFRATRISNLLHVIEEAGQVRRHACRRRRDIELVARGLVLTEAGPPLPIAEYLALRAI